jgi:hypothetical protein
MRAIGARVAHPAAGQRPSADLEVLPRADAGRDGAGELPQSGFKPTTARPAATWRQIVEALRERDEFALDPTRITLVCGTAGYDGTAVQGAARRALRHPDQQDLAQQRPGPDQHQQHPQRRGAPRQGAGRHRARDRQAPAPRAAKSAKRAAFAARVKSLMEDVPDLPNFSRFHDAFPRQREERDVRGPHARGLLHGLRRRELRVPEARFEGRSTSG